MRLTSDSSGLPPLPCEDHPDSKRKLRNWNIAGRVAEYCDRTRADVYKRAVLIAGASFVGLGEDAKSAEQVFAAVPSIAARAGTSERKVQYVLSAAVASGELDDLGKRTSHGQWVRVYGLAPILARLDAVHEAERVAADAPDAPVVPSGPASPVVHPVHPRGWCTACTQGVVHPVHPTHQKSISRKG